MGAGLKAAGRGVWSQSARGPYSGTGYIEFARTFFDRQALSGSGARREAGRRRGTHIAVIAMGIIAAGNRGNRQLALAWDDSLVTPLRSLGRPENVGTRSLVLGVL